MKCRLSCQWFCGVLILSIGTTVLAAQRPVVNKAARLAQYGQVELMRDAWGVPHVFSASDQGAFYGQGYACAQDRGFQMYYFLRIIQGRLAEVVGDVAKLKKGRPGTAAQSDELMRTFGFAHAAQEAAEHLDAETLAMLKAYCQGVNDYFADNPGREHPLFAKLGLEREPWTPEACILSWWHMAQFFAKNGLNDSPSFELPNRNRPGAPQVGPDDDAAVVRREDVSEAWIQRVTEFVQSHGLLPKSSPGPDDPNPKFSHAWVIGGSKTTTGAAVLISDPQTPVWNPNMFYEFHFKGKTFNARGIGVPGSPLILIGFNQSVAWGVTALGADQADLFLLKTDAARPNQYEVDGQWLDMKVREETIKIKDGEARRIKVRHTLFGPVVSNWVQRNSRGQQFALMRVPMAETDRDTIQAALPMFRATTCDQFAQALPRWRFPTANCVFGDAKGNIGYWSLGALPVRSVLSQHGGSTAQDGRTRRGAWQGMIPYDLLPHVMNPKRGYLVTANHRTIQSFYKMPFGTMTGSGGDTDRGLRIKELIQEHMATHETFSPEDVLAMQDDCVSVWKREIAHLGFVLLARKDTRLSKDAALALAYLQPWYRAGAAMDAHVRGTELAEKISVIFRGGNYGIVAKYGGGVSGLARFAKATRQRFDRDPATEVTDDEAIFCSTLLGNAWMQCVRAYGDDTNQWQMKAVKSRTAQRMPYLGSLDGFPGLDPTLDVSVPHLRTFDGSTILSQRAQTYTQFVPLHEVDAALSILPPGTSEDPASPFRFSTLAHWSQGTLHPAPLSRAASETIMVSIKDLTETPPRPRRVRSAPRAPQRPQAVRKPLPGKSPSDPILQSAIRYLNRSERTEPEVQAKLEELSRYVQGHDDRKAELVDGLKLFIHLMTESQAGRMPISYGTTRTLEQVEVFYGRLMSPKRR
ncbi:MAG: penicillin acylase family protein [Phycisphaeraceae bacterium]|nr:penicillin acylase family protein [Phycisphaeraceae bacterium]